MKQILYKLLHKLKAEKFHSLFVYDYEYLDYLLENLRSSAKRMCYRKN